MPRGASRIWWNVLMGIAVALAFTGASVSILNDKAMLPGTSIAFKHIGLTLLAILFVLAVVIHFKRKNSGEASTASG